MPSLREFLQFVLDVAAHGSGPGEGGFTDDLARELERQVQSRFPGERVYIAPSGRRNDPERAARIADLARRLPTGVVAERVGVSRQYVHRLVKKVNSRPR